MQTQKSDDWQKFLPFLGDKFVYDHVYQATTIIEEFTDLDASVKNRLTEVHTEQSKEMTETSTP